ncbi:hypothetical protein SO694_00010165 [Aureococcus anophagefferens]|uniref:EF-hand domain-containing protein n=1 Tax=Aureococcus anophagefferens TaxID=44056 RepID=A0ABR1GFJ7_AURAN
MLLLKLANAGREEDANVGSDAWKREFALEAVPLVAACALGNNPEPLENVSQPRKVAFDGAKFVWETRDKASGHAAVARHSTGEPGASSAAQVAVCNAHNKYEQDFAALQADPARLQEAKNKAKKHNKQLNPFKKRMPDPTITGCHTATVELLALTGVPETAEVNALGCFVVRTTETAILCECVPDRPKFGPPPVTVEGKRKLAEETCMEWIVHLLGLLEDEMNDLGLEFDIAQYDAGAANRVMQRTTRAAAAKEAKEKKAKAKHRKEGQVEVLVKDPTAPTPMNSLALVAHGCAAMLNLISEPGVNARVRAKYQDEIRKVPETLSQGIASSSKDLIMKKLEILFMLKELDLVEANLFRLDKKMRTPRYKSVVLYWRKHLGYSALSSATEGFDKQTLRRLQETFAEIDEDGSGYLSPEELAALFKLRMPMSQSKLEDIVDEVDIDGNGLIDFEEFLLVVKNMKNMKSVQSKLGVKLKKAIDDNRREKLTDEIKEVDKDVLEYQHNHKEFFMKRYQIKGDWVLVAKLVYAAALDWGDGVVSAEPLIQALVNNPQWVEQLGFAKKRRGMAMDKHAQAKYQDTLRLASTYQTLSEQARAGIARRGGGGGDDDASDGGDDDDEHWDYQTFEDNVVKLIRAFRRSEQQAREDKLKREENMERGAEEEAVVASRLRRLALGSKADVPDPDA